MNRNTSTEAATMDAWLGEDIEFIAGLLSDEIQASWDDVEDYCAICGRCTDHSAEHDDLVDAGHAVWNDRARSYEWTDAGWDAHLERVAQTFRDRADAGV